MKLKIVMKLASLMVCLLALLFTGCQNSPESTLLSSEFQQVKPNSVSQSPTVYTQSVVVPVQQNLIIPCALGGGGEIIVLRGDLHVLFHITQWNDVFHINMLFNPQGLTGVGQATGTIYRATGSTRDSFSLKSGLTETYVNNFHIIGPGQSANLIVHQTLRLTVDDNGDVHVSVNHWVIDCL